MSYIQQFQRQIKEAYVDNFASPTILLPSGQKVTVWQGTKSGSAFVNGSMGDVLKDVIKGENKVDSPELLYATVGALNRCIQYRADSISSLPREVEDISTGEVIAQANFPTPRQGPDGRILGEDTLPFQISLTRILTQIEKALCVYAQAYLHKEHNNYFITAVVWQDPALITPVIGEHGFEKFTKTVGKKEIPIPVEDICYIYTPGLREFRPDTPLAKVAITKAGILYHQDKFLTSFFETGAMPVTLVFAKSAPPEPVMQKIRFFLQQALTGRSKAWDIHVLPGDQMLEFKTLTPLLKDMILTELSEESRLDICATMGVPASVLYTNASRNSTSEQDDEHFYTKTVIPQALLIEEALNEGLFADAGLRLRFHYEALPVFQQARFKKAAELQVFFPYMTNAEIRAAIGLLPNAEVDEMRHQASAATALPATTTPSPANVSNDTPTNTAVATNTNENMDGGDDMKSLPYGLSKLQYKAMMADMNKWRSKVLQRYPKSPPANVPFTSDHIVEPVKTAVFKALMFANTPDQIRAAFERPFLHMRERDVSN